MLPVRENIITKSVILPLSGDKVIIKPFKGRQEKELMLLKETGNPEEIIDTLKTLIAYCVVSGVKNIGRLAHIDFLFLFIESVKLSKTTKQPIVLTCKKKDDSGKECGNEYKIMTSLDNYEVVIPDGYTDKVDMGDVVFTMKPITLDSITFIDKEDIIASIARCVHYVSQGETIYDEFEDSEMLDYILDLSPDELKMLYDYFENLPYIKLAIPFKCPECGYKDTIVYNDILSFFALRS